MVMKGAMEQLTTNCESERHKDCSSAEQTVSVSEMGIDTSSGTTCLGIRKDETKSKKKENNNFKQQKLVM